MFVFDDPDVLILILLPPVYERLDPNDCRYGDLDVLRSGLVAAGFVKPRSEVLFPPNLILA